jgi:hypothetical protein
MWGFRSTQMIRCMYATFYSINLEWRRSHERRHAVLLLSSRAAPPPCLRAAAAPRLLFYCLVCVCLRVRTVIPLTSPPYEAAQPELGVPTSGSTTFPGQVTSGYSQGTP